MLQLQRTVAVAVGRRARPKLRIGRGEGKRAHDVALVFLWTEIDQGHQHVAIFDGNGWGITNEVRGHTHEIRGLELQPAADGHSHELSIERAEAAPTVYYAYRAMLLRDDFEEG